MHRDLPGPEIQHTALAETLLRRMAKDLEEKAEIQQAPKREGRNMIMFLTPRKTPLVKKEEKEQAANKAVRTIPPAKAHRREGGQPPGLNHRVTSQQQAPSLGRGLGVESIAGFTHEAVVGIGILHKAQALAGGIDLA